MTWHTEYNTFEGRASETGGSFLDLIHFEMNRGAGGAESLWHLVNPDSPASCLPPLLTQLNWSGQLSELNNALPHFSNDITLTDVRNTLIALGYKTSRFKARPRDIDNRVAPCLFEWPDTGTVGVIIGASDGVRYAFINGEYRRLSAAEEWKKGYAYGVTRLDVDEPQATQTDKFVLSVLSRFRSSIGQLLLISFFSTLLALATPLFVMTTYDRVIGHHSLGSLPMLLIGVSVALLADLMLRVIRGRLIGAAAGRIDFLLGSSTFRKLLALPLSYTARSSISTQISRLREFESLRDFFTGPGANALADLPFVFILIVAIGFIAPPLVFAPLISIGLYILFGAIWTPKARHGEKTFGLAASQRQEFLVESLMRMRDVKQCGAEGTWLERFRLHSAKACAAQRQVQDSNAIKEAVSQGIMSASALLILVAGAFAVLQGQATVGGLIASMALTWRILNPIQAAFLAGTRLSQIMVSVRQIDRLIRINEQRVAQTNSLLRPEFYGDITFSRVSFRYPGTEDPALVGMTFKLEAGEMLAVIGPNSSGKSTILKLLAGLYRPQAGSISLDGMDLRQISPTILRRYVAYVPQNTNLFYGSLAQNLRFANPTASDQEVWAALEEAGVRHIVETFPHRLEQRLGDIATEQMPAGFTRRLAVARALVSSAPVILLDEPEQNLDAEGDDLFFNLIDTLKGIRTIVIVSHRPSYVRLADKALYLREGIAEFAGPPDQVLEKSAALVRENLAA
ncbi:MAG: peptidase domain-containing ABC transporter [Pseudomonadota bacterium]